MEKIKNTKKAKIGIYTMGLLCYWAQFDGLRERLLSYGKFIASKVEAMGASVYYYGLVDCEEEGHKAGEYFVSNHVDLSCTQRYLCNQCFCSSGSSNL